MGDGVVTETQQPNNVARPKRHSPDFGAHPVTTPQSGRKNNIDKDKLLNESRRQTEVAYASVKKKARATVIETTRSDKLGEYITRDSKLVAKLGIEGAIRYRLKRNDWGNLKRVAQHPAARLLRHYKAHGVPVTLADTPWTHEEILGAMKRGPHKSAYEYEEFLREDMADYVDKGYWMVIPFSAVANDPMLRASPIGVVPQHSRRPRPIIDYTFYGVNDSTQPNVPLEAMQFGRALERLIRSILLSNPRYGKVQLIKVDLADGFYRVWLAPRDAIKLAVVFPHTETEPELLAVPLTLPMGWKNSPPFFSTATETIADVTNRRILQNAKEPRHRLEPQANSKPPKEDTKSRGDDKTTTVTPAQTSPSPAPIAVPIPTRRDPHLASSRRRRLQSIDIYVDDFLGAAQGSRKRLNYVRRVLLNCIDDVFRPKDSLDTNKRKEPISVKKLLKGDASWATVKEVLGWIINTENLTLNLTPRRHSRLQEQLFTNFPVGRKRATVPDWRQLLGELRSLTLALPGSRHLFSVLQHTLQQANENSLVKLTPLVHQVLGDFRELYHQLPQRPTRLPELVPLTPTLHGTHDAAGHGMGGVWFPTATTHHRSLRLRDQQNRRSIPTRPAPVVWRLPFPQDIQDRLVSFDNPGGDITNTDLELAGSIMHQECAVQCFDVRERTTLSRTDNMGTMYWQRKGSTTTTKAAAELLRIQGLHQRYHRTVPLHDFIPGPENPEADDASRLQSLSDDAFLSHFNTIFPQTPSWRMWTPSRAMSSSLIGALRKKRLPSVSLQTEPRPPIHTGTSGQSFAASWPSTHLFKTSKTQWTSSKSSYTSTEPAVSHRKESLSAAAPLRMPYAVLAKRSLQWGPKTHDIQPKAGWISVLPDKSLTTRSRTLRQTGSNQSQCKSFSL